MRRQLARRPAPTLRGKPERPYKSLAHYRESIIKYETTATDFFRENPNKWPCLECSGTGKVRHYEDRDPVEGYKGAPWHQCGACGGSRCSNPEVFKASYHQIIDKYLKDKAQWKAIVEALKSARRKLTLLEFQAVHLLGGL